jgi:hypothetical protein
MLTGQRAEGGGSIREDKSRLRRMSETAIESGFLTLAAVCGYVLVFQGLGWIQVSPPVQVLVLAAWCALFWGKYWLARRGPRWSAWLVFSCAFALTAATILAAVVILVRLAK